MLVYSIRVSQGKVATLLVCGKNFDKSFVANWLQNVPVFFKSVRN